MYSLLILLIIGCESLPMNESVNCNACIKKCCRQGFYYRQDQYPSDRLGSCVQNDTAHFSVPIYSSDTKLKDLEDGFSIGLVNCSDENVRYFKLDRTTYFYMQQNGSLYYSRSKTLYSNLDYCIDMIDEIITYFFCNQNAVVVPVSAKILNSTFLLATFLVFVTLPERNIHEKTVVFHILCLIVANIILTVNQYYKIEDDDLLCSEGKTYIFLGYILLYSRSASDFWMNSMCIDIWHTFSGTYVLRRLSYNERSRLIFLNTYSWGVPGLILLIVVLFKNSDPENSYLYPGIYQESCCFRGVPYHVFDNGPKLILFVFNTGLNILTIINIQKVSEESSVVVRVVNKCPTCVVDPRFSLYWKLVFITTYGFITVFHSVLLVAYDVPFQPRLITYFIFYAKLFSTTYGFAFFVTFVFKKRVWKGLKQRYQQCVGPLKIRKTWKSLRIFKNLSSENEAPGIVLIPLYSTKEEVI